MIGKTHLAGGVATAAVICLIGRIEIAPAIGGIACSALGALLPDVDHKGSMMGKKIKPVSTAIGAVVGHRKFFHWFAPYLLLFAIACWWKPEYYLFFQFTLCGVLSHLLLDACNPSGIPLFPTIKFHLLKIRTGSMGDQVIGAVLSIISILCLFYWIINQVF